MDKHKHNHCEHKNLEYCIHCKVVHCLDCRQEFPETKVVTVEKIVYKDRWTYPQPTVSWEASSSDNTVPLINAISDKKVWDQDRFEHKIVGDLVKCSHRRVDA